MRSPVNASPIPSRVPAHDSGVDAVRYSFIVMDLHHLLLAGLPAHSAFPPIATEPQTSLVGPVCWQKRKSLSFAIRLATASAWTVSP